MGLMMASGELNLSCNLTENTVDGSISHKLVDYPYYIILKITDGARRYWWTYSVVPVDYSE